ncbi:MAG TPA: histidine kinase [Gemmatimonadaceae bacterium]|nr:histidine kinase [Gemmatimonadaceae bacterium]
MAVGLGTLFGLVSAGQVHLYGHAVGREIAVWQLVPVYLARWYIWVVLTPFIFAAARRWQLGGDTARGTRALNAAMLAVASVLFALLHSVLSALVDLALGSGRVLVPLAVTEHVSAFFVTGLVVCAAIIAVYHAIDYYRRYRSRELRASHLGAQLAQTKLQLLRTQLQPHFLFNTLNAVSALMHEDLEAADAMLAALGDLLRAALRGDGAEEVSLRQEVELTRCYLDIMKLRFGGELSASIEIAPDSLDALVPNMLLQPLVENAVLHGIAQRSRGGSVEVRAQHTDGSLVITVLDDGPGLPDGWEERSSAGVGLSNTRSRLRRLYGKRQRIDIGNRAEGGLCLTLTIPFHTTSVLALPAA